jgi:hypothetical protein
LIHFCHTENIPIKIVDERCKHDEIDINSKIELLPHQKDVLERTQGKDFGVKASCDIRLSGFQNRLL